MNDIERDMSETEIQEIIEFIIENGDDIDDINNMSENELKTLYAKTVIQVLIGG